MTAQTPIARSKSAALVRTLASISAGYTRYTSGQVAAEKAERLARKFHDRYGIGCTTSQRHTRKQQGVANTLLVMYWPPDATRVEWLLLATTGTGLEAETWREAADKPRLVWLGYELVQLPKPKQRRPAWTWRRPKQAMADLYSLLATQLGSHRSNRDAVAATLARIAHQPGFAGIRTQGKALFDFARRRGFAGELPPLPYLQRIGHGDSLYLEQLSPRLKPGCNIHHRQVV